MNFDVSVLIEDRKVLVSRDGSCGGAWELGPGGLVGGFELKLNMSF